MAGKRTNEQPEPEPVEVPSEILTDQAKADDTVIVHKSNEQESN